MAAVNRLSSFTASLNEITTDIVRNRHKEHTQARTLSLACMYHFKLCFSFRIDSEEFRRLVVKLVCRYRFCT